MMRGILKFSYISFLISLLRLHVKMKQHLTTNILLFIAIYLIFTASSLVGREDPRHVPAVAVPHLVDHGGNVVVVRTQLLLHPDSAQ